MAKKNKKQIPEIPFFFVICAVFSIVVVGYFFIGDLFDATKTLVEELPNTELVKTGNEVADIIVQVGDALPDNMSLSELEKQLNETSSDSSANAPHLAFGEVVRIVDGDTYELLVDGKELKIRLIGVDTPESVAPEEYYKDNTEVGALVSDIVKGKIKAGDTLFIEYDVDATDDYGRTLAYLYFEDGTRVQDWLLSNGYAQVVTIQPNSKYAEHFVELEQSAVQKGIGLWAFEN